MFANGTFATSRNVRYLVAVGGKADVALGYLTVRQPGCFSVRCRAATCYASDLRCVTTLGGTCGDGS